MARRDGPAGTLQGLWAQLRARLARGEVSAISDWPVPRAIDALQRLCHDLLRRAHGAAPSYFPAESLPAPGQPEPLLAWVQVLQRAARHAEHPLNAGLLLESLVLQGQAALKPARPVSRRA